MAREMKDSGIKWLGYIPQNWDTIAFWQAITRMGTGLNPRDNFKLTKEDPLFYVTIRNFRDGKLYLDNNCDRISRKAWYIIQERSDLHKGDILFASISKDGQAYILKEEPDNWNVNESVFCIRVNKQVYDVKYFYYHLIDKAYYDDLHMDATGSTFQSIKQNKLKKSHLVLPPIIEQERISVFLDTECSCIDTIIGQTQASIEEYKKLKQAIITHAVTKGIRPNRSMKDSGISWVKKIPTDWYSINPKALFSQRKDKAKLGERQLTASQQFGVIYQDEYMELTGSKIVIVEKDFDILKHVAKGDFVISMRSFQGGLEYSTKEGSISSAYVMLIPNTEKVFPRFYRWLLKSQVYINALQSTSNMVRDGQAMRYSNFVQVRLYTVPLDEQREIADYLDDKCQSIDTLIETKTRLLQELEMYKKSLIYEYVTGKKEVHQ